MRLKGARSELQFSLPTPPGTEWQRYLVPLDDPAGWTVVDAIGSRQATAEDLRQDLNVTGSLWIRGLYADGGAKTWIDNIAVELHH